MSASEAAPPFNKASGSTSDNHRPPPDLAIRSSDGVVFYVQKAILCIASHTFAAMCGGTDSFARFEEPGLPGLILTEDAKTLDALFRICYPVENPELKSVAVIFAVMEASRKYMVDVGTHACIKAIMHPDFLKQDPFSVFAIACHFQLTDDAHVAAKETLHHPFPPVYGTAPPGLQWLNGTALFDLFANRKYFSACLSFGYG